MGFDVRRRVGELTTREGRGSCLPGVRRRTGCFSVRPGKQPQADTGPWRCPGQEPNTDVTNARQDVAGIPRWACGIRACPRERPSCRPRCWDSHGATFVESLRLGYLQPGANHLRELGLIMLMKRTTTPRTEANVYLTDQRNRPRVILGSRVVWFSRAVLQNKGELVCKRNDQNSEGAFARTVKCPLKRSAAPR